MPIYTSWHFQKLMSCWILGIQKLVQHISNLLEINGLGNVTAEARLHALGVYITQDVGTESNDWNMVLVLFTLPLKNLFARVVAVLDRHLQVTLIKVREDLGVNDKRFTRMSLK
jgi:hypothetical protein